MGRSSARSRLYQTWSISTERGAVGLGISDCLAAALSSLGSLSSACIFSYAEQRQTLLLPLHQRCSALALCSSQWAMCLHLPHATLTVCAAGVDFPHQFQLMTSYLGILDLD